MPRGDIDTYHEGDLWHNRVQGETRPATSHGTKAEAERVGRRMAQERRVEHVIKNLDGTIGERNSYGNDPRNIHG